MDPAAMVPHGRAMRAYAEGDLSAQLLIRRDDGNEAPLAVSHFFRPPDEFTSIERAALERCRGHVLDIGAGTGLHSAVLQSKGVTVTAIDINPEAVAIMQGRGIQDVRCADVFTFHGGPFDTLLMLGHGIGVVETLDGLDRFLTHAKTLAAPGCGLLIHSLDVCRSNASEHVAYREATRQAGRYVGEMRLQFEFAGQSGPYCGWLHVDADTLVQHAASAGWSCEAVLEEETEDYLACLTGPQPT